MASAYDKASLVMLPHATKEGKVYSVKPEDRSGDFTFTRSTAATRVNADGFIEKETQNLLTYSNNFGNTAWSKNSASVTGGQSGYDGSNDAWRLTSISGISPYINQGNYSVLRTHSIYAKAGTYDQVSIIVGGYTQGVQFDLTSGTIVNNSNASLYYPTITQVGATGWYRISVFVAPTAPTYGFLIAAQILAGGGISAGEYIYIQDAQTEYSLVARDYIETTTTAVEGGITDNVPRLDYTDSSCPALLLEPQRTNLLPQSEFYGSGSDWSVLSNSSITSNAVTSPEGNQNASLLTFTNSGSNTQFYRVVQTTGSKQVLSVFVKYISGSGTGFRLSKSSVIEYGINLEFSNNGATLTGTPGVNVDSYKIEDYGNKWFRVSLVVNWSSSALEYNIYRYSGTGTDVYAIYGLQLEGSASYATSYIPTYGSSVTRVADAAQITSATDLIGQTEGTLFIELGDINANADDDVCIELSDGTTNNRILVYADSSGDIRNQIKASGTISSLINTNVTLASNQKIAITYATNEAKVFINGVQYGGTDTSVVVPSTDQINLSNFTNIIAQSRTIKQALVFKTKLTDAELAALTTI